MVKILVLQLARYGDIFLTWPTLRALQRRFPGAEIHCLVRRRFAEALDGCEAVSRVWVLDTPNIMEPLLAPETSVAEASARLTEFVDLIAEHDFDLVVNLSFSPLSSYITSLVSGPTTQVRGYTRHSDGYLAIPDDPSAYFYAQVGIGRQNRYHLGEIFAAVADVDLVPDDWRPPESWQLSTKANALKEKFSWLQGPYVAVHVAASQARKTLAPYKWRRVFQGLERAWPGSIVLIGSQAERVIGEEIILGSGLSRTHNLIGLSDFSESLVVIQGASVLLGADSAPMHLAGFSATPCLNLSFAGVNFWETGPRPLGSRILFAEDSEALATDRIIAEAVAMLKGEVTEQPVVVRTTAAPIAYEWRNHKVDDFSWRLIEAIYTGGPWPVVTSGQIARGLFELREVVHLGQKQIASFSDQRRQVVATELSTQVDQTVEAIGRMVPEIRPLIAWFQTESVRIPPGDLPTLIERTEDVYRQMVAVLELYLPSTPSISEVSP